MKLLMVNSYSLSAILIKLFTFSKWNHVAVLFDDDTVFDSVYSEGGVRKMTYQEFINIYHNVEELDLSIKDEKAGREFAEKQLGKKYDWTAILGIVFQSRYWEKDDRWFCSELAEAIILACGVRRFRTHVSTVLPRDVYMVA